MGGIWPKQYSHMFLLRKSFPRINIESGWLGPGSGITARSTLGTLVFQFVKPVVVKYSKSIH